MHRMPVPASPAVLGRPPTSTGFAGCAGLTPHQYRPRWLCWADPPPVPASPAVLGRPPTSTGFAGCAGPTPHQYRPRWLCWADPPPVPASPAVLGRPPTHQYWPRRLCWADPPPVPASPAVLGRPPTVRMCVHDMCTYMYGVILRIVRAGCHPVAVARALTAKVRGPRFNPGWLPVFHSSLKIFPSLSSCAVVYVTVTLILINVHWP